MITVSIVEDEDRPAFTVAKFLGDFSKESGEHFDIKRYKDGLAFLDNYRKADLVFMDIEMPFLNGIEVSKKLREIDNQAVLIFITNMAQYAISGYSVNALDFMVKPITYSDFCFKLKRAMNAIKAFKNDEVVVQLKDGIRRFQSNELCYLEIKGHSLTYHLEQDSFSLRGTLTQAAKTFPTFIQCNSCYLVNPIHIEWVKGYELKVGGDILAISRPRRKDFMNALSIWYSKGGI